MAAYSGTPVAQVNTHHAMCRFGAVLHLSDELGEFWQWLCHTDNIPQHFTSPLLKDYPTFLVKKGKGVCIAIYGNSSHNCGVSLAVWDHTVLPSTRHKRTHPAFTPARQAGTRFIDHLRVEG